MKDNFWNDETAKEFCEYAGLRIGKGVDIRQHVSLLIEDFKKSKEKDIPNGFEILSFLWHSQIWYTKNMTPYEINDCIEKQKIHSVKRLDGEVFTVDGKFLTDYSYELTVNNFQIVDNKILVWSKERGYWPLNSIKPLPKPKEPLFTTGKNEPIYDKDIYWFVTTEFDKFQNIAGKWVANGNSNNRFLTEKEADEYILLNKPIEVCFGAIQKVIDDNWSALDNGRTTMRGISIAISDFFKSKINP